MSSVGQSVEVVPGIEGGRASAAAIVRPRGWLVRRALLAADVVGLVLAFSVTEAIYGDVTRRETFSTTDEIGLFLLTLPVWILLAKLYGLYDRDETRTDHGTSDDLGGVFHLTTVGTWIVIAGSRITHLADPHLLRVTVFWGLAIVSIVVARSIARTV
jgi:hypothetical protein